MKKALIIFIVIVLTVPSFSQEKPDISTKQNVFKINALSLLIGTGSIFYERKLSELTSAQLGVSYLNYTFGDTKFAGLILTPECRLYATRNAIDGFYVAPYLRYQKFTLEYNPDASKGSFISMGGGVVVGQQWITHSGFTMDLFFGAHYSSGSVKVDSGTDRFNLNLFKGFRPRAGFAIGFAF
jgi:hypothetical protein